MDYEDYEYYYNEDYDEDYEDYEDYTYQDKSSSLARRQGDFSEQEELLELAGNNRKLKKEKVTKSGKNDSLRGKSGQFRFFNVPIHPEMQDFLFGELWKFPPYSPILLENVVFLPTGVNCFEL